MERFGQRLASIRKEKKMSQNDLAKRVGVARPSVTQWESGAKIPSMASLEKISSALDVSLDWLTGKSDKPFTVEEQQFVKKIEDAVPVDQIAKEHPISINGKVLTEKQKKLFIAYALMLVEDEKE